MTYEQLENVIALMNVFLYAYIWAHLLPSIRPGKWWQPVYILCLAAAVYALDHYSTLVVRLFPEATPVVRVSILPLCSAVLSYALLLPLLSRLLTRQPLRRCVLTGLKFLLSLYTAEAVMAYLIWPLFFRNTAGSVLDLINPSASRASVMVMSQPMIHLILTTVYLASQHRGRHRYWYLLVFPLWSIFVSNALQHLLVIYRGQSSAATLLLCSAVVNLMVILITGQILRLMEQYFSYQQLSQRHQQAAQARQLQTDYEALAQAQARELEEVQAAIRRTLRGAFPPDGTPAAAQTQALLQQIAQIPQVSYCANPLVNSVLTLKHRRAQELGIHLEIQVWHTDTGHVENLDLCSLLGNLLDNAMEACAPLAAREEPVILLTLRSQGRLLALSIENPVAQVPQPGADGSYPSTKPDPEHHGLGLRNARRIAQRYHGCLLLEVRDRTFRATAMLDTTGPTAS